MNHQIKKDDNPDLIEERSKATFDTDAFGAFIWGGYNNLKRRREIARYYEDHKELHDPVPIAFMTREEKLENAYRKASIFENHIKKACDVNNSEEVRYFNWLVYHIDGHPTSVHSVMGFPTIINQSDKEQQERWIQPGENREYLATYAQTELGHGTNLKKLETTATYEPKTEEFILNSPTVTSLKWWPGNMGHSSNVAIVMAQLWINNKCYGPHPFFVQIRDPKTHKPLPGVTVGDIGPKFGLNTTDNGFLKLDHVRVPRKNMLMKHAKVFSNGTYVPPVHDKIAYSSMMLVRAFITPLMGEHLCIGATIAIRYSAIRRQGEIKPGDGEVQILDYQTQQYRLFPQLARGIAFLLAGRNTYNFCNNVLEDIKNGDVSLLADLHAILCGLKAISSYQAELGLEQCRMACGGHGYSAASGFPLLNSNQFNGVTVEGDNLVLLLQVARYLMKRAKEIRCGQQPSKSNEIYDYLFDDAPKKCLIDQAYVPNYKHVLESFEYLSKKLTLQAYDKLEQLKQRGRTSEVAWNECSVELCKAARAHIRTFLARTFINEVNKVNGLPLLTVLKDLLQLYLFYEVNECMAGLMEDGYMLGQQLHYVKKNIYEALTKIRPNAVSIVDSFDFTDRELNSVLGRRDGHVYENLLKWAQASPLNKHDVLPFHHKYLGRMMEEARQKSRL